MTRFYLSDVSADAVALSRRNFERNEFSATFLHGDLFSPMREVISRDPTARPHYVYLYPPQIAPENPESNDPRPGDPQPRVSVFTPTTAMHFFRRFAAELVDILAPGAIVWIGIDLPIVEEGRHIFQAAGPDAKLRKFRQARRRAAAQGPQGWAAQDRDPGPELLGCSPGATRVRVAGALARVRFMTLSPEDRGPGPGPPEQERPGRPGPTREPTCREATSSSQLRTSRI